MRFDEGIWDVRENIKVTKAIEVDTLSTHLDDSQSSARNPSNSAPFLKALCTTRHVRHRGDRINYPTITVKVTSPAAGVIGIEATHFYRKRVLKEPTAPHFPQGKPESDPATVNVSSESATLVTAGGKASATLDLTESSFSVAIHDEQGKYVTGIGTEAVAWVLNTAATPQLAMMENASQTINDPYYRAPEKSRQAYMSVGMTLEPGEKVYGFGERFGAFIKNGQTIESSNDDRGTSGDGAYKSIPFYLTNRDYGVLVDHLDHTSFEVQSDKMTRVQMSVPGETIRLFVFVGTSPKDVLANYTTFTGRAPLPPDWSFGLWLSTSFLTDYDEKTVTSYIDRMEELDIPLHVFHFDCFWMRAHAWCDFQFDPKFFPDPKGFLDRLHQRGIKVCVWINPWVGQASRLFQEGDENGYFVKTTDGLTFQSDSWQPGCATVDFTNPAATKWWQGYLSELVDIGVDSFKTDFGERITTEGVVYHDGSNPRTMHNAYTMLYNQAVWNVLVEKRGVAEACLFARSATTGTQRFPVHWGGDVDSTFNGLAETIRGGLSHGISGFGYHSSDIGGFKAEGKSGIGKGSIPNGAVYKRWCQFGLLSSHSRLHGSGAVRVPWLVDDEACAVLSKFTKLKGRLEPYLTSESLKGVVAQGVPLMRPLFLEFAKDRNVWNIDQQYMLGSDLLVAPVFGESQVEYYVPSGVWVNLLTGVEVTGPAWVTEEHSMLTLPVLIRQNRGLIIGNAGHSVLDNIAVTGFTVVITTAYTEKGSIAVALRDGSDIEVEINPQLQGGRIVGYSAEIVKGSAPFTLVVLGGGTGLDTVGEGKLAENGVCHFTFQ